MSRRTLPLVALLGALVGMQAMPCRAQTPLDPFTDADFVQIKPGTFQMGDASIADARPHTVTLTHGFRMQKTLVTQAQWQEVMKTNPSAHHNCPSCPVDNVSYDQAEEFISVLNDRDPSKQYRFPTEAEWEYAARAGTTGDYGTPGALTLSAWISTNSGGQTHPVGGLAPNAWGLYDMTGNVWEWVSDWYALYPSGPATDPTGPVTGGSCGNGQGCRVLRGGSCSTTAPNARVGTRLILNPSTQIIILRAAPGQGRMTAPCVSAFPNGDDDCDGESITAPDAVGAINGGRADPPVRVCVGTIH